MFYRTCVLLLLLVLPLPVVDVLAAPAPDPYAILDIGPPPEGKSAEEYCKEQLVLLTKPRGDFIRYMYIPQELADKLPTIARLKGEYRPWAAKNIRIMPEDEGRCLRLTFRAGNRAEQVVILNALVRAYFEPLGVNFRIRILENALRGDERIVAVNEMLIERGRIHARRLDSFRRGLNDLRFNEIPAQRAEIARLKQVAVIRWAK